MHATPVGGLLDIGCFPNGSDALAERLAQDLAQAGMDSHVDPSVMHLKYGKLVENLANAVQALCGLDATAGRLVRAVRVEGEDVLRAAKIDFASEHDMDQRRAEAKLELRPIEGQDRGGSTWQSLARRAGSVETDYLNGEIALLGALNGVPTPYNRMLQRIAAKAVREGREPGSYAVEDLMAEAKGRP